MKLTGFDELLTDVAAFEQELAAPASFYESHRESYYRSARAITASVLAFIKPEDESPEEWKHKTGKVIDRITTELLAGGNGIVFGFTDEDGISDGSRPAKQTMTFHDIKQWIQAGIDGEPGGKRITAIDQAVFSKKGIDGVASIVMKAYYSLRPDPRYARLRAAIQRYFLGARARDLDPILDSISAAWAEHFSVVIPKDLEKHAAKLCRGF